MNGAHLHWHWVPSARQSSEALHGKLESSTRLEAAAWRDVLGTASSVHNFMSDTPCWKVKGGVQNKTKTITVSTESHALHYGKRKGGNSLFPMWICTLWSREKNNLRGEETLRSKFQLQRENKNTVGVMLRAFILSVLRWRLLQRVAPKLTPLPFACAPATTKLIFDLWPPWQHIICFRVLKQGMVGDD